MNDMLFICDVNDMNEFLPLHAWCQLLIQRMLYVSNVVFFSGNSTRDVMCRCFDLFMSMSRASGKLILLDHGCESNPRPSHF